MRGLIGANDPAPLKDTSVVWHFLCMGSPFCSLPVGTSSSSGGEVAGIRAGWRSQSSQLRRLSTGKVGCASKAPNFCDVRRCCDAPTIANRRQVENGTARKFSTTTRGFNRKILRMLGVDCFTVAQSSSLLSFSCPLCLLSLLGLFFFHALGILQPLGFFTGSVCHYHPA